MNKQGALIAPCVGHIVDLWRMVTMQVRNPYSYTKYRQIAAFGRRTDSKILLEAGTYLGNTAMRCSHRFDKVITIELDSELFQKSKQFLRRRGNVECLEGDALKVLQEVLQRDDVTDALVFLDGHFSGGATALGDLAEPACEEIELLAKHQSKINAIVVDDFRCFGVDRGWPKRSELLRCVEDFLPDFDFTIHLDQLLIWRRK